MVFQLNAEFTKQTCTCIWAHFIQCCWKWITKTLPAIIQIVIIYQKITNVWDRITGKLFLVIYHPKSLYLSKANSSIINFNRNAHTNGKFCSIYLCWSPFLIKLKACLKHILKKDPSASVFLQYQDLTCKYIGYPVFSSTLRKSWEKSEEKLMKLNYIFYLYVAYIVFCLQLYTYWHDNFIFIWL